MNRRRRRSEMNLKVMNVANSIADHDALAVRCQRNCLGRAVQRYFGTADPLLEVPEPECAVIGAREGMEPVGANRNCADGFGVFRKRMQELTC